MALTLKKARLISEKTQKEMAEAIGVYVETYRKLEKNPELCTIEQAKKIARYLNLTVNEIFFAN